MEAGGLTQYLTRVQGMSKNIEDKLQALIASFMWNGNKSAVSPDWLQQPIDNGGKKLLDIEARNEAIDIMRVKTYLRGDAHRPRWTKIADKLIARATPKTENAMNEDLKTNMYLQTWHPMLSKRRSPLPEPLRKMLITAKKYNVTIDPPAISKELRRRMPIWHHKGKAAGKKAIRETQYTRCHRATHQVQTAGQMADYATTQHPPDHRDRRDCNCEVCVPLRARGCQYPAACMKAGRRILDNLAPRWDPRGRDLEPEDILDEPANGEITISRKLTTGPDIWNEIRIFGEERHVQDDPAIPAAGMANGETLVYISTHVETSKTDIPKLVTGLWYPDEPDNNTAIEILEQGTNTMAGDAAAILHALQRSPPMSHLRLKVLSKQLKKILTMDRATHENRGWLDLQYGKTLAAILSLIRSRPTPVTIEVVEKTNRHIQDAKALADDTDEATRVANAPAIQGDANFTQTGAKLACMTQSSLYKGIRLAKQPPGRRRSTQENMEATQEGVATISDRYPTPGEVWTSLRRKEFDKKTRTFLWKAMHEAYKCGKYWNHIPNYEHRGHCETCGTTDSIEHALTQCRASGQEEIWRLTKLLWQKRGLRWKRPTLGMILGC
ncbi:hypothetical protein CVT26_011981, partial [Gymnopilus dilepis]